MRPDRHRDLTNLIDRAPDETALVKLERQVRGEIQHQHDLQVLIAKRLAGMRQERK